MPKNHIRPHKVANAVSMAASVNSSPTNIEYLDNTSFQVLWTGSPVGILDAEVSNDYNPKGQNPAIPRNDTGSWSKLNLLDNTGSPINTSTVSSPYTIDLALLAEAYVRISYTRTSGTGSMTVFVTSKSVS